MVTIFKRIINAEVLVVNSLQNESDLHVNNLPHNKQRNGTL